MTALAAFQEGVQLSNSGKYAEAIDFFDRALAASPNDEWTLSNSGYCLFRLGKYRESISRLEHGVELYPKNLVMRANLVSVLDAAGLWYRLIPHLRILCETGDAPTEACFRLAHCLASLGRVSEAIVYYQKGLALDCSDHRKISEYLGMLNYSDQETAATIAQQHFLWGKKFAAPLNEQCFARSWDKDRRLKIAFLSSDLFNHPVCKILVAMLPQLSQASFDVTVFNDSPRRDHWTDRISKAASVIVPTARWPDDQLQQYIEKAKIDILLEINGHSGTKNRLQMLARRVAPIQISFLGYPATTGVPEIDFKITDEYADPPGIADEFYSEKLVRIPAGMFGYTPDVALPAVTKSPCHQRGFVTFGCFNNPVKASPALIATWAAILRSLPDSRLVLKYGQLYQGPIGEVWKDLWYHRFGLLGIPPHRILFKEPDESLADHLRGIAEVDIALDTFPYQGTMTTVDTLCASVPVVSLAGDSYCQRASSAILSKLGFDEFVADSPRRYVETAVRLAETTKELVGIREKIRERLLASNLFRPDLYVHEFEKCLRSLWIDRCGKTNDGC
ncbi:MAG: Tetratricopeptide 2 repeat protein [Planctomycetaceae bacterium]|nr:Tetratricopeptide 2 repeat protein [Planctomycetaceae bacterium]